MRNILTCINRNGKLFTLIIMVLVFSGCVIDNEDTPLDLSPPQLIKPVTGQLMDNGCVNNRIPVNWDFEWTSKVGAVRYHFRLKAQNAIVAAVDNDNITINTYRHTINGYIAPQFTQNWTWQVRAYIRGNWTEWSTGTFNVRDLDTGC